MANIIDGICPEGSILDGFDDWPRSATRKEWFRITRGLIQQTIAEMDLDPAALAVNEKGRWLPKPPPFLMPDCYSDAPPVRTDNQLKATNNNC